MRNDSAACQEPQNFPAGLRVQQGKGGAKAVVVVTAHPGWGKLEDKSRPVSQIDDEFLERSNAVL